MRPAIVSVPERAGPEFAAIVKVTTPLPLPVEPPVTEIHETLLVVVHAHPAGPVTFTLPVPPAAEAV